MGVSYNPKTVTDGLILYVDAANPKSYPGAGLTWTDLSGNGRNLTLSANTSFTADKGGGLTFITDSNASVSTTFSISSGFTLSVWVKHATLGTAEIQRYITISPDAAGLRKNSTTATRLQTYFLNSTATLRQTELDGQIFINNYYNFTSTYDGTVLRLYNNGVQVSSLTTTDIMRTPTAIQLSAIGESMLGNIYAAKVYNRALSATEIQQNFNALRGRFSL